MTVTDRVSCHNRDNQTGDDIMATKLQASASAPTARVLIVDDHPALCEGLEHRISAQPDFSVCGQAPDVDEALVKIRELQPEVVIVDIALKGSDGLELIKAIHTHHKEIKTLVHSMYEESIYADRCLHAGAMGYVNKGAHPDEVINALREVLAGRVYLSPSMTRIILGRTVSGTDPSCDPIESLTDRQLEIFRLIGEGLTARKIANRLHISVHTVETHRENIKCKLDAATSNELTRRAILWVSEQSANRTAVRNDRDRTA
jgi:DNA-binding NarL/FixJ family response regulator